MPSSLRPPAPCRVLTWAIQLAVKRFSRCWQYCRPVDRSSIIFDTVDGFGIGCTEYLDAYVSRHVVGPHTIEDPSSQLKFSAGSMPNSPITDLRPFLCHPYFTLARQDFVAVSDTTRDQETIAFSSLNKTGVHQFSVAYSVRA